MALSLLCVNMVRFSILESLMCSHHGTAWSASFILPSSRLSLGAETVWQQEIWKKLTEVGEEVGGHGRGWKVGKS